MKPTAQWLWLGAIMIISVAVLLSCGNEGSKLDNLSDKIRFSDGKHKKYYTNGALQGEWSYRSDKLHGEGIECYPNGKTKYKDFWVNGELVWRQTYDANGVLIESFGEKPAPFAQTERNDSP